MQGPKISALLPVYNTKEQYLREAIESLLAQTFTDFELLVYNDGSPDPNVEQVVLSYNDPRIRYHRGEKNIGISGARNWLLEAATGEYLAVIDHDDISRPERFAKEVAYLDAHPDAGIVGTWVRVFPHWPEKYQRPPVDPDVIEEALTYSMVLSHPSLMMRRSVIIETGVRYDDQYFPSEDCAFLNALVGKTRFGVVPEVLLDYRRHPKNTSRIKRKKLKLSLFRTYAQARANHPDLWNKVLVSHTFKTEIRLFGIIPLLTLKRYLNKTKWFLFGFILILTVKTSISGNQLSDL